MINYEIQGKMVVITGATKDEVGIEIPEVIEGCQVGKIETNAFVEMPKLKKVVLPKTVKVIGAYAFASCPLLSEVVLSEGLETIEDWAFISCNIESIELPKTIKSVGTNAFLGNICKEEVDKFMKEKDSRKVQGRSNGHCASFPMELMEARESINSDIIASRARYIDDQLDQIENGSLVDTDLDVPFYFDGDEFMVAVWHKKEMPDITFEVAGESKALMGVYSEVDPQFLVLRINVLAKGNLVSNFIIKTPYLEGVKVINKSVETLNKDGLNYCFVHAQIEEACYGNGNYDQEFAINQFNQLAGKFKTEFKNKLITQDQYEEITDAIDATVLNVTQGFLAQIDGAPKWTYLINLKRKLEDDPAYDQIKLQQYIFEHTVKYYNELHDIYSLREIAFRLDEHVKAIEELTGTTLDELNKKYDISLTNAEGIDISEEEAASYEAKFLELDTNYVLHGDFLIYIYKEMSKLNSKYGLYAFSA